MSAFLSTVHGLDSTRYLAAVHFLLLASAVCAQQPRLASLGGMVRDAEGKAVPGAFVQLQKKDSPQAVRRETDGQGGFVFVSLEAGTYELWATKVGFDPGDIAWVLVESGKHRMVDLTLRVASQKGEPKASAPQFFDQPQFTVAGVTDATALGGHGSDTVVRTRNSLAQDTVGLERLPEATTGSGDRLDREMALRKTIEERPADFAANHQLGKLLFDQGKAKEAVPYFERAAAAIPSDYQNAYDLALANARAGDYPRAHDEIGSLMAGHDTAELHHLLGDVCEKLGDSLAAVRQYQRAAELDASETNIFDWGSELLLHHAPLPAEEVFAKGRQLFPRSERMGIALGAALFTEGAYEQGVEQVSAASDLNPEDPVPYLFLGKMQSAEAAPSPEVAEKFHRFLTLQPDNAQANYYYAVALWKLRKAAPDKASGAQIESLLNRALRIDPQAAPAHLQLGILRSDESNYTGAILEFELAAQIDPQMEEAHYRLAQAYRQQGDTGKAQEELGIYAQLAKESNEKLDRERHEIKQFVYRLRDPTGPPAR
jgi:tetratricopeptide (TPR) repeat protein